MLRVSVCLSVCVLCRLFNQLYCIHNVFDKLPHLCTSIYSSYTTIDLGCPHSSSPWIKTTSPPHEVTATNDQSRTVQFYGETALCVGHNNVKTFYWNRYTCIHTHIVKMSEGCLQENAKNCMRCVDWFFDFFKVKVKSIEIAVKW